MRTGRAADQALMGEPLRDSAAQRLGVAGPPLQEIAGPARPRDPRRHIGRGLRARAAFRAVGPGRSLPTIRALDDACLERSLDPGPAPRTGATAGTSRNSRSSARGPATARPSTSTPRGFRTIDPSRSRSLAELLEPLWTHPITRRSPRPRRAMFLDPKSPWLPRSQRGGPHIYPMDQIASPLVVRRRLPRGLARGLADRTQIGTAAGGPRRGAVHARRRAGAGRQRRPRPRSRRQAGVEVPIRMCDYVAWKLSALDGAPECELTWPEARRDEAVAAAAAYLRRYGPASPPRPAGRARLPHTRAHLRFPRSAARPRPTTSARPARLLARRRGRGPRRGLPSGYPVRASGSRSRPSRSTAVSSRGTHDPPRLPPGRLGLAGGGGAQKGTAGSGPTASSATRRSPASRPRRSSSRSTRFGQPKLPGGLEAQLRLADPPRSRVPARPAGRRFAPAPERPGGRAAGPDRVRPPGRRRQAGPPAGVSLALFEIPKGPTGQPVECLPTADRIEHRPSRTARFDPGNASRMLAPTESFEAFRSTSTTGSPRSGRAPTGSRSASGRIRASEKGRRTTSASGLSGPTIVKYEIMHYRSGLIAGRLSMVLLVLS